ncbi:MAG: YCF48-related protein [Candidatus Margulisiibacteriota bacterium]
MRKLLFIVFIVLFQATAFAATTWVSQTSDLPPAASAGGLNDVFFIDENTGIAVGNDEMIVKYKKEPNGSFSWTKKTVTVTGATFDCNAVYFPSANTGYVVGSQSTDGIFSKSTDGGDFWSSGTVLSQATAIQDVFFIDDNTGWICGNTSDPLSKTTDGGTTWPAKATGLNPYMTYYGIFFTSSRVGWVVGQSGVIYKTTDGGDNWSGQTSGTVNTLNDVFFVDSSKGWAVGDSGTILKTINGGTTWTSETSGTANNLNAVHFPTASKGWAVGDSGVILSSTDGGDTWGSETSGTTADINGVYFADQYNGWVVGEGASAANIVETAAIVSITSVTRSHPTAGDVSWDSQGAFRQIEVTGGNFNSGTTLSFPGSTISVYNVTMESSTKLNATIWVPLTETAATKSAKVVNTDTANDTLVNAFEIRAATTRPSITIVDVSNAVAGSSIELTDNPGITIEVEETTDGVSAEAIRFSILIGDPPTYYWTFSPSGQGFFTAVDETPAGLATKARVHVGGWYKVKKLTSGAEQDIQDVFTVGNKVAVYFYVEDADSIPSTLKLYDSQVYCQFPNVQVGKNNQFITYPNYATKNNPQVTIQFETDAGRDLTGAVIKGFSIQGAQGMNHSLNFRRVNSGSAASAVRAAAGKETQQATVNATDYYGEILPNGLYRAYIVLNDEIIASGHFAVKN